MGPRWDVSSCQEHSGLGAGRYGALYFEYCLGFRKTPSSPTHFFFHKDKEKCWGGPVGCAAQYLASVVAGTLHFPEPPPCLQMFQLLLLALSCLESPVFMASGKSWLTSVSALHQEHCPVLLPSPQLAHS